MEWMIFPFKRYFDFSGRSCRKEFWLFTLMTMVVGLAIELADGSILDNAPALEALGWVWTAATMVPGIAVGARRLHDIDRSGWWQLLWIVPLVGWIALLFF